MLPKRPTRPFEDDPGDFLASPGWSGSLPPITGKFLVGLGVVALLVAAWPFVAKLTHRMSGLDVFVRGHGVSELQPGARVVLDSQEVGRVIGSEIRGGQRFAHVRIDGKYARQIPRESQFEVDSLNEWMPGNLGIRLRCPTSPTSSDVLGTGTEVDAVERILPPAIPPRFYLLVGACCVVVVLLIALARLVRAGLIIVVGIAVIVAVLAHLNGMITVP